MKTAIGFIGAGNMAFALARAITGKALAQELPVYDIRRERMELFQRDFPGARPAANAVEVARAAPVVLLAVKPQDIPVVMEQLREIDALVISIAAGVSLQRLEIGLPRARVVRVMPNAACMVQEMAAGYAVGGRVTAEDRARVEALLSAAGVAMEVAEERMDAVTALSGSGPAFVALLIQAFIEAGTELGLEAGVARELTLQTFRGTARLLQDTGMSPQKLVDMVSSPQGTTVAGRGVLQASAYRTTIAETLKAAARRSRELGA